MKTLVISYNYRGLHWQERGVACHIQRTVLESQQINLIWLIYFSLIKLLTHCNNSYLAGGLKVTQSYQNALQYTYIVGYKWCN